MGAKIGVLLNCGQQSQFSKVRREFDAGRVNLDPPMTCADWPVTRASDFPFQKKQFSVSKKVKFRFDSVSLLATLNSMKSQYIERKCGERTVKMAQLVR